MGLFVGLGWIVAQEVGTDLVRLTELAVSELLGAAPGLADGDRIAKGVAIIAAMEDEKSGAAKLGVALQADPSFGNLRGGWIQHRSGSGMMVQEHMLPHLMIRRVMSGKSAESLVAEAREFAASPTSATEYYASIAGVTVSDTVSLGDNIDLIPWADVPDGLQKTAFSGGSSHEAGFSISSFVNRPATATSAIRARSAEYQILFSSHDDAKAATETAGEERALRQVVVNDVVRCITALSTRTVAVIGGWSQFDREIANDIASASYEYGSTLFESAVRAASSKPIALDGVSLAGLFRRFDKFKESEKVVMRVALDRLIQAIRRQNTVDKAIDLGIALEVLLLHGINDRGELRFRTSIRGATFLEGTKSERLESFKLLRAAYDLRSEAVHSGVLKTEKKGPPPEQVLEEAIDTCAAIARKLIDRGSFPDWDVDYVIGGA